MKLKGTSKSFSVLVPAVVGASGVLASAIKQCQSLDTGLSRTKAGDTGAPGAATADFVVIQTAWMKAFGDGVCIDLHAAGSKVTMQTLSPGYTHTEFQQAMGLDPEISA